ncbi:MAG: septum formation initiator family protein [Clostridia bacterium]|nr:septum formation initiator family protein [Clostridia bacterium]
MRTRVNVKPRFWVYVIIVTLLVFGIIFVIQGNTMSGQYRQIASLEAQRIEMLEQNEVLLERIDFSQTEEYIERYARSELGMLKEGEIRFVTRGVSE